MNGLLIVNTGSSSIKFTVFDADLNPELTGNVSGIGGRSRISLRGRSLNLTLPDHRAALRAIFDGLAEEKIDIGSLNAAAHRIVHGGTVLTAPAVITPEVRHVIERCAHLAPLHNPHGLAAIDAVTAHAPHLVQTASFDTAFHASNPDVATRYALPLGETGDGLRRFGFHGISYSAIPGRLPQVSGAPLPPRVLALHLGNGSSLCALHNGMSVATTMGYSPLSGMAMGTRVGDIDGNAVLALAERWGIDRTAAMLNRESGLTALGGTPDMQQLLDRDDAEARFTVDYYCYWAVRHAGSMIAAMGGLDAVVFTAGIGENAPKIRERIMRGLAWTGLVADATANAANAACISDPRSAVSAWILPANEERSIAEEALSLLDANRTAQAQAPAL